MTEQIIIIAAIISFLILGFYIKKGKIRTIGEFSISRNKLNWFPIAGGISMTYIGGAALLNTSSLGYSYGWYPMVDAFAFIGAMILVIIFIRKIRNDKGVTVADLVSGSDRNLSILVGFISALVFILILSAQFVALSKLIAPYFPNTPNEILTIVPSALIFLYVFIGGFKSVTKTDILQLIFITVFLLIPIVYIFFQGESIIKPTSGHEFSVMPTNLIILLSVPLIYLPFSQDVNIRVKSGKSTKHSIFGLIAGATIYLLLIAGTTFIGISLANKGVSLNDGEQAYTIFFKEFYPNFGVVAILAALAAIISSLDSFSLNAITTISNDIISKFTKRKEDTSFLLRLAGVIVFTLSIIIALYFNQILAIILAAIVLYVSVIGPIAIGKYLKLNDKLILIFSIITISVLAFLELSNFDFEPKAVTYPLIGCTLIILPYFVKKLLRK